MATHGTTALAEVSTPARGGYVSGWRAVFVAAISLLRGLPLLVMRRPRTPLRVLCVAAFDTVSVFRSSKRLSWQRMRTLAALLDFGASVNDHFDGDGFSTKEYRATRRLLAVARPTVPMDDYVDRLRQLEGRRPAPGGDARTYRSVQAYRESVIRVSLSTVAATAMDNVTIDSAIDATRRDGDLGILFRIVMQCQIIDDVVDQTADTRNGLPGFLTAHASIRTAFTLASTASDQYATVGRNAGPETLPFRIALCCVSRMAKLVIVCGHWRAGKVSDGATVRPNPA